MSTNKRQFNVLHLSFDNKKVGYYDILPYFRNEWKSKSNKQNREEIKNKADFKNWIIKKSRFQFWARCQYEFLIAPWPLGSYEMNKRVREVINKDNFNLDDYSSNIAFHNAIMHDMHKIDIHEQIMMNIDTITNILFDEFKIKNNE